MSLLKGALMISGFILAMLLAMFAVICMLAFSNAKLWVEIKAMQKSTHTLTYIDPLTQSFNKPSAVEEAEMTQDPFETL